MPSRKATAARESSDGRRIQLSRSPRVRPCVGMLVGRPPSAPRALCLRAAASTACRGLRSASCRQPRASPTPACWPPACHPPPFAHLPIQHRELSCVVRLRS
jgi:hypothetical protein